MIKTALQNTGKMNAVSLFPAMGKEWGLKSPSGSGENVSGQGSTPFSILFARIIQQGLTKQGLPGLAAGQVSPAEGVSGLIKAGIGEGEALFPLLAAGADEGDSGVPLLPGSINDLLSLFSVNGEMSGEPGQEMVALEVNFGFLLEAFQAEKLSGEDPALGGDPVLSELKSFIRTMAQAFATQDVHSGPLQAIASDTGSPGAIAAVTSDVAEAARHLIRQLLLMPEGQASTGTDSAQKGWLVLPKAMLANVLNEGSQQMLPVSHGTGNDQPLQAISSRGEPLGAGRMLPLIVLDESGKQIRFQLVRLEAQATTTPGAALAAALGTQKADRTGGARSAEVHAAGTEGKDFSPVSASRGEPSVRGEGERPAREGLFNPLPGGTLVKGSAPEGADSRQTPLTGDADGEGAERAAVKIAENGKEALRFREETGKILQAVTGKEVIQGASPAGAAASQLASAAAAMPKGVFIPMDRLAQKAAEALTNRAGKVQMTLQPPSLGTITMDVVVQKNRVELVLTANRADVQQMLQTHADQLRVALTNQGFEIDQMSVLLKREGFAFHSGGGNSWQEGTAQHAGKANGTAGEPDDTPVAPEVFRRDNDGVTISIFA